MPEKENPSKITERLNAAIDAAVNEERIVGAVVLAALDGDVIYEQAAGWANRESLQPMQANTIFRLASMSKPIISAATLALCEQGKIHLDDPITKYLPEFRPRMTNGRVPEIRLWHLLTHTAGLGYGFDIPPDNEPYASAGISDGIDNTGISLEENLRRLASVPLFYVPGSEWRYSLAIDVLGAAIERATGSALPEIVRSLVTVPLGMADTDFSVNAPSRLATAYADSLVHGEPARLMTDADTLRKELGGIVHYAPGRALDATAFLSAGSGMVGTAHDYLCFLEALRQGGAPILQAETTHRMVEDQVPLLTAGDPGIGFGFGFGTVRDPVVAKTPKGVGSWGWAGIYGTTFWVDPAVRLSVIALTNTALEGVTGSFAADVVDAVYSNKRMAYQDFS
jgi:CubicO group peptidase (beta-lactamase class C family)